MKRPEISDRLTEGARLREDRDAIEAQIDRLCEERTRLFDRIDAINAQLGELDAALDEADDTIRDVDLERNERPITL